MRWLRATWAAELTHAPDCFFSECTLSRPFNAAAVGVHRRASVAIARDVGERAAALDVAVGFMSSSLPANA